MIKAIRLISIVYRKELIDILRDRRTLLAMVLIPVVLYPVLMLGFVWAAQAEQVRVRGEQHVVEVPDARTREELVAVLSLARSAETQAGPAAAEVTQDTVSDPEPDVPSTQPAFVVQVGDTPRDQLGDEVQLKVQLRRVARPAPLPPVVHATIVYNEVNVHSRAAMQQLRNWLNDYAEGVIRRSIHVILDRQSVLNGLDLGTPAPPSSQLDVDAILTPVEVETESTTTEWQRGGWVLGQVIPLVLVLMTITGAVYPAIDLTAGERERGTLETLMAAPVPTVYVIAGKFLVVATVGFLTAVLNLASVGTTMHFGGLTQLVAAEMPVEFPYTILPVVLVCMIPLALLFSAILVAVSSFARTFKEAQNYVMPVIIGAMIPSVAVTLPTIRLEGVMLVLPVGNMVLLTRELFQQTCDGPTIAVVLLSTSLYAVAALAIAARLFGQEAVLFADVGSYRTLLLRRYYQAMARPSAAQALMLVALLFPVTFYVQSALFSGDGAGFLDSLQRLAIVQFVGLFALVPLAVCGYAKINVGQTFRLGPPRVSAMIAAVLLGLSSWALAHEYLLFQSQYLPPSESLMRFSRVIEPQLRATPLWRVVALLAVIPAVSEELLFRGFLLSGLSSSLRRVGAIIGSAVVFAVFHFMIDRLPITFMLGAVLAFVCWQSRSIWPGMVFHAMHNAWMVALPRFPDLAQRLGFMTQVETQGHLHSAVLIAAGGLFAGGLVLLTLQRSGPSPPQVSAPAGGG